MSPRKRAQQIRDTSQRFSLARSVPFRSATQLDKVALARMRTLCVCVLAGEPNASDWTSLSMGAAQFVCARVRVCVRATNTSAAYCELGRCAGELMSF